MSSRSSVSLLLRSLGANAVSVQHAYDFPFTALPLQFMKAVLIGCNKVYGFQFSKRVRQCSLDLAIVVATADTDMLKREGFQIVDKLRTFRRIKMLVEKSVDSPRRSAEGTNSFIIKLL